MNRKKILLGLGSVATIVAPVAATVSCFGYTDDSKNQPKIKTPIKWKWKTAISDKVSDNLEWPKGITTIKENQFFSCIFEKGFVIPSTITKIVKNAFERCTFGLGVELPSTVKTIEDATYDNYRSDKNTMWSPGKIGPGSKIIPLPSLSGKTTISKGVFNYAHIDTPNYIPSTVKTIGPEAFDNVYIESGFKIPNTVKTLDVTAFKRIMVNGNYPRWTYADGTMHDDPQPGSVLF